MAFHLGNRDQENLSRSLGQANANKNALAETTHASMGYSGGSPVRHIDDRMAGDAIGGYLGMNGEFATAIRDPQGADNLQAYVELLYNGPFSPLPPPVM
jgi:hypothetical protein